VLGITLPGLSIFWGEIFKYIYVTVLYCGQILKHVGLVILLKRSFTFTFYFILEQFQTKPDLKHLEPEVGPNINLLKSEKARARESQPEPEKCRPDPPLVLCMFD